MDRQKIDKTQKKHDHLNKQQAVATQIPTQFEQKLEILLISTYLLS